MNEEERTMEIKIAKVEVPRGWYVSRYCLRIELIRMNKTAPLEKLSTDWQILLQFSRETKHGDAVVWASSSNMKQWQWNVNDKTHGMNPMYHGRNLTRKTAIAQATKALNKLEGQKQPLTKGKMRLKSEIIIENAELEAENENLRDWVNHLSEGHGPCATCPKEHP